MSMTMPWGYLLQQAWVAGIAGGLCVLAAWLWRRLARGRGPAIWAVAGSCLGMGLTLLLGCVLFRPLGAFFLIGLLFYGAGVWIPLRVLWSFPLLRGSWPGRVLLALALGAMGVSGHATLVAPDQLVAREETLVAGTLAIPELRVALVADLQSVGPGAREARCVELVNQFAPHFVVLAGDYIQCEWIEDPLIAAMREVIAGFKPLVATVAVTSDSDDAFQRRRLFQGLPVRYLENAGVAFTVDRQRVFLAGLEHRWPNLHGALRGVKPDDFLVLVSHAPDPLWFLTPASLPPLTPPIGVMVSGHTHGGQLHVPGYGPVVTLSRVPRRVAGGGTFTTPAGWTLVQSRGIGMEGGFAPRFRVFCPPEVVLLRFVQAVPGK